MSAARWRKAMASGGSLPSSGGSLPAALTPRVAAATPAANAPRAASWTAAIGAHVRPRHLIVLAALIAYPFFATPFFTYQVAAQSLALGLIALSLSFLAGYGGMVSLAQMTVAGIAGYMIAIFGVSSFEISMQWPWWIYVPKSILIATLCATLIGVLSVRTEGIYTIMITLAIGVAFFYLTQQNMAVFHGFDGFQEVHPPQVFGIDWRQPLPFYFLALGCALAGYFFVKYIGRSTFGLALQGIRDNARRMRALGFNVTAHRIAAYAVAGFMAAVGGVLLVWYNGQISPGSIGTAAMINILVIAVLGGMRHPIGAFIGALVVVLLQTFARDLVGAERVNLVIGGAFLLIVLFSPDGLLGLWQRLRRAASSPRDRTAHRS